MKNEFNKAAAMSREVETNILSGKLTPTQASDYQALLHGQEVTRVSSESRMFQERPQLVQAEFNRQIEAANAPSLDLEPKVRDHAKVVRDAQDAAEKKVTAHETRRSASREELGADSRWRFVKAAEAENTGKDANDIDLKGR
ncbi:MAG: hypothetical protein ACREF9_13875 [Opitutaceae bacterium]